MSVSRTVLCALAATALLAPATAWAQSATGGAPSFDAVAAVGAVLAPPAGPPDGGPDGATDGATSEPDDGVGIASRPTADRTELARHVATILREQAVPLPLALGSGVAAFVPRSAMPIAVFHPSRRPIGAPVMALACAAGGCAVEVRPALVVAPGRAGEIALRRQSAALTAGHTFVVRLRLTRAQRAAVAAAARPRLRLRITVVDRGGARHAAVRTVPVAAPLSA